MNGLYSKNSAPEDPGRVIIGNKEIIGERDTRIVKCYPETVVNDYVPFYFSVRTPMLFNIITGQGGVHFKLTRLSCGFKFSLYEFNYFVPLAIHVRYA